MKCKFCGGELLFKNKIYQCNSCGATIALESVYENIDVYICYEETDNAGRRTKDSIIAQEIYRKLEENRITTFYERISADGLIGDDLELSKHTAIHLAKVIIVLGTSTEAFNELERKYSSLIIDKAVIPFCVDVNPSAISKTLSKIQAMSYSTIGWDKDLIKGIFNILGREQIVDIGSVYEQTKRRKIIICAVIAFLMAVIFGVIAWGFLVQNDTTKNQVGEQNQLTQKEIYDNANNLLNQGNLIESLKLFWQIPDYLNSANSIKLIYEKFEGYYYDEESNLSLHLTISGNKKADIEISYQVNDAFVKITESGQIDISKINFQYIDSENNSGNLTLELSNEYVTLTIQPDATTEVSIGQKEIKFLVIEKSDQPHVKAVDANTLLEWIDKKVSVLEISRMGYELEEMGSMFGDTRGMSMYGYKIKNTDIQLLTVNYGVASDWLFDSLNNNNLTQKDMIVFSVSAPAGIMLPDKIGKTSYPFISDNYMFAPNGVYSSDSSVTLSLLGDSTKTISTDSPVCIISMNYIQQDTWETLYKETIGYYLCDVQIHNDIDICRDGMNYKSRRADILAESEDNFLIMISREILEGNSTLPASAAYYSVSKQTYKATLVYEYIIPESDRNSYKHWDMWENYPDLFGEFLDINTQQNVSDTPSNENFSEDPVKMTFSDWKEAYLYVIDYAKDEHVSYALVHIDSDNVPELYMNGSSEARGDGLYSFKNGKVIELRLGRTRGGSYIEKSGTVYNHNGNMGYYYTEIYKLDADGFSLIFNGSMEEAIIQNDSGDYESSYVYSIDGVSVNEEEYTNAINQVFNIDKSTLLYKNAVEYSLIKSQINNYSD